MTNLPPGKEPINCKYVYKTKFNSDGTIERLKVKLVAKGYTQQEGIDYHETFSPMVKMVTVRCLLALAAVCVCVCKLLGYTKGKVGQVCKLLKSLYGLKQASRQWHAKFSNSLIHYGFQQSKSDYSLIKMINGDFFLVLLVYVDDIVVASNSLDCINSLKGFLNTHFKIKDLGSLRYFLGIEVAKSAQGIHLCQRKYTLDILSDLGNLGSKPAKLPMDQNLKFSKDSGFPLPDPSIYRRLVGRLLYLTITRPNISYSVQVLSQFMSQPTNAHLHVAHKVLKYLKGNSSQGILMYSSSPLQLQGYCDSDWASCPDTRRSITGFCIFLGNSLVS
ncbi:uncharacterized mitochondrial protein AtMg00810-like [Juglans regia]|nr:uncharacterized mitochondrial protein AtMg00810-like [Juglans regia]